MAQATHQPVSMTPSANSEGEGTVHPVSNNTPAARMLDWPSLMEHHRNFRSQQHQHRILHQLGAVLEFMVDPINVSRKDLMEFAFRLRLAFGGKELWNDVSSLIYAACQDYPASAKSFTDPQEPSITDLAHNHSYLTECANSGRLEHLTLVRKERYEHGWARREASPTASSDSGTTMHAGGTSHTVAVIDGGVTDADDYGVLRNFEDYLTGTCSIMDDRLNSA